MWPKIRGAQINIPVQIAIDHKQQQPGPELITNKRLILHPNWLLQKG